MKVVRLWSVLLFSSLASAATEAQTPVTVDDLTAPMTPAFVVLDIAPASVERPETPKAFTVAILAKLASTSGVPQNYAIDVAPYWLGSHPGLTFHQYQHPNVWRSLVQTFAVSIGTAPLPGATAAADPTGTRLGVGVRTSVLNGRPNPAIEKLVATLHDVDDEILNLLNANRAVSAQLRTTAREAAAAIQAADAERIGWFVRVAAGQAWAFPNDDVKLRVDERLAVWVTPSYRFLACRSSDGCESMFEITGVARGVREQRHDWGFDYGGRFLWRPTRAFDASIESVGRRAPRGTEIVADASGRTTTNRVAGILEYRIRQDLVVYASFGRDFTTRAGVRPLVSFLGMNVGLGTKPLVTVD
jgi:hypothetical protein